MTNIEKWPQAFENGIPKVGGRWTWRYDGRMNEFYVVRTSGEKVWHSGIEIFGEGYFATMARNSDFAFLGFPDSAPVNQGAAAPQAASVVGDGFEMVSNFGCTLGCGKQAITGCRSCYAGRCADHASPHLPQCKHFKRVAPIAAPPPSLKAAVQQEGLTIHPQAGTRHEFWETFAQAEEGGQNYKGAKESRAKAQAVLAADLAYDVEADAIRSNRVVRKASLRGMGAGDLACFKLRNLREFEAIKSAEHAQWNWWAR